MSKRKGGNAVEYEPEGQCPLCPNQRAFDSTTKSVTCGGKSFTFPFSIYWCNKHGYMFYRRHERKHTLLDLAKHRHSAIVEPLPSGVWSETWDDFKIIKVNCPVCGYEWKQMKRPWLNKDISIFCSNCGSEIPLEHRHIA